MAKVLPARPLRQLSGFAPWLKIYNQARGWSDSASAVLQATCVDATIITPHAEGANAVGAVAGGIIQRRQVLISPLGDGSHVRLHLPDGIRDFEQIEAAVEHARAVMLPWVAAQATEAGAEQVVTQMTRCDQIVPDARGGEIYLGTELSFVATGRPRVARGLLEGNHTRVR